MHVPPCWRKPWCCVESSAGTGDMGLGLPCSSYARRGTGPWDAEGGQTARKASWPVSSGHCQMLMRRQNESARPSAGQRPLPLVDPVIAPAHHLCVAMVTEGERIWKKSKMLQEKVRFSEHTEKLSVACFPAPPPKGSLYITGCSPGLRDQRGWNRDSAPPWPSMAPHDVRFPSPWSRLTSLTNLLSP